MSHFQEIYRTRAADYERLVAREDYEGNILAELRRVAPLEGRDVADFGAGTGRLSMLVAPLVKSLLVLDGSAHMLRVAHTKLLASEHVHWHALVADNRAVPLADASVDVSLAGWSFGHSTEWDADAWQHEIGRAVDEMERVLRPGGVAVIFETMGTGSEEPAPPNAELAAYYAWLEGERGYQSTAFRTDYEFASLDEAESLTRFFFGDAMAEAVIANDWRILPECTGMWWKNKP